MQKKLKQATVWATIFVIIVFTLQYFSTKEKNTLFYQNYNQDVQEQEEDSQQEKDENKTIEQQKVTSVGNQLSEIFNYNTPFKEEDPRSLKIQNKKKLNYFDYADRIRMEIPETLDENGLYVALMQAVEDNDIKKAKKLISMGARLNSPDGNTFYAPIFWAISNGNVEMVDLLLKNGAKVNTPDDRGLFPIHWVVESASSRPLVYRMKEIFDLILDTYPGEINRQDTLLKQTPLMLSVISNNKKAFAYLLDRGANVNILDKEERDIIDFSIDNRCHACVSLIDYKKQQNAITPLVNFASTFTAPDPIWLPYSTNKKTSKRKTQYKDPYTIVIQGDSLSIPVYKTMPQILPLENKQEPDIIITER